MKKNNEKYVNPIIAWGALAAELVIIFVIAFLVCRP